MQTKHDVILRTSGKLRSRYLGREVLELYPLSVHWLSSPLLTVRHWLIQKPRPLPVQARQVIGGHMGGFLSSRAHDFDQCNEPL